MCDVCVCDVYQAAEVHRQVRKYAQSILKPGIGMIDLCQLRVFVCGVCVCACACSAAHSQCERLCACSAAHSPCVCVCVCVYVCDSVLLVHIVHCVIS